MFAKLKKAMGKSLQKKKKAPFVGKEYKPIKIVVLGLGAPGKTRMILNFVCNPLGVDLEALDPTIEDTYEKIVQIDGRDVVLNILDTSGQDIFTALRDQWIRTGNGFMVCYNVRSTNEFEEVPILLDQITRVLDKNIDEVPLTVIGNGCDIRESQRYVSKEQGQELASKIGAVFFETSAVTGENIREAFLSAAERVLYFRFAERFDNANKSVLCFLCIRWFSKQFKDIPKDVWVLIAKKIWGTRKEKCWE